MSSVRQTTTEWVFATLRASILSGELAAGTRHSVYQLAGELGVSRTPVREAVLRLTDAGLVTVERNRGIRIRGVTAEDVRDVFELRLLIEVPAAAYAAGAAADGLLIEVKEASLRLHALADTGDTEAFGVADRHLHAVIASAVGNRHVVAEIERLRDLIAVRGASTIGRSRTTRDIAGEHDAIVEAVCEGEPVAAARAMREHLVRTGTLLMRQLSDGEVDESWAERLRSPSSE
ncbi:hypothetical protein BHE97_03780 [Aeromicrobium sp. PE09-221]|uniref:GntR family transcriptional regulator n=1 Tax=Aeromicrobium sp. PE09-221 TaxID=1898043 RepID=UPI000B752AC4|nr:GntR family transcriptional regulator [Aeromicrobium sp. PE09-221]OUZ11642.1 hypothetical protein BHE97_03780 [Aeromicrobium sp. PE09-221]